MTLFVPSNGYRQPIAKSRIAATATTLFTASEKRQGVIDSILVSNNSTGSVTVKVWVTDGTTDFYIVEDVAIAATGQVQIKDHHFPLQNGWSLKVQAGTANRLDVTAVILISSPSGQR